MKKGTIISILWLCGTPWLFGDCGSAHDTDFDGPYVSSTSPDKCGSGHVSLVAPNETPRARSQAVYEAALREHFPNGSILPHGYNYPDNDGLPAGLIDRLSQIDDTALPFLQISALKSVFELEDDDPWSDAIVPAIRSCGANRKAVFPAAHARGWQ